MLFKINEKISIFFKTWLLYVFSYYPIRAFFISSYPDFYYEPTLNKIFFAIITSPFAGILGIYDNFPFFIFIQVLLMFSIYKLNKDMFHSYVITIIISHLFLIFFNYNTIVVKKQLLFNFISLFIAILVNWLILKKKYKLYSK